MQFKKVGVIGCGTMGSGIAQVCAEANYDVIVVEPTEELLTRGINLISSFLDKGIKKGKVTEQHKQKVLSKIKRTTKLEDLSDCDIIIEAVFEKMDLKKEIFAKIDRIAKLECYFATNTSCLSITEMASVTKRANMFCGLHFFNPAQLLKLVEVIKAVQTDDETIKIASAFVKSLGKEPVVCKDSPGFIVNYFVIAYLNQAVQALDSGLATKEDIDKAIELGLGYPMGPFSLIDMIGLDVHLHVTSAMYEETKDPRYAPPPLLQKMVRAGLLGRKTGKGFYEYK